MIYARAHDQTVADDYFAAMQRIEQRLEIIQEPRRKANDEVVKVRVCTTLSRLTEQLVLPELSLEDRASIAAQLRRLFGLQEEHAPPEEGILRQIWSDIAAGGHS